MSEKISEVIKKRIEFAGARYWANDNISEFIEENEKQQELLLNLLLEKMQEIAECKNTDIKKALENYKKDLHKIYGLVIDMEIK